MRDNPLDICSFLDQLKIIGESNSQRSEFLRTTVVDSSNFHGEFLTNLIMPRNLDDCIALAISSWYIGSEEIRVLIQIELEEISQKNSDFWILTLLLKSKAHCELFLIETNLFHTRDFFGNIYTGQRLQRVYRNLNFRRRNKIVKELARKRGYHDKGSLKDTSKWLPTHDYSLNRLHEDIESKRLSLVDTTHFIEGFVT